MKKMMKCFLPVLFITLIPNNLIYAEDTSEMNIQNDVCKSINMNLDYGSIVYGGDITINGKTQYLYCEFQNTEEAINNFAKQHNSILQDIEATYNLESLNNDNWELYRENFNQYINDISIYDSENNQILPNEEEIIRVEQFFDIFENTFENNKIKDTVEHATLNRSFVNEEEMALLLPTYSPLAERFIEDNLMGQNKIQEKQNLLRINNSGVNYATTWATSINTNNYDYFGRGDCANFASQILEASGVKQVSSLNVSSGWWHYSQGRWSGNNYLVDHYHSTSWVRADTFARYMGVGYTTKSHYNFAANIQKYDFIAFDRANDGSWDHIGYVTADDNYIGSYGYYDYKVAQHSTNYHAWASSSTNNWDTLESYGALYGRVRR